MRFTFGLMLGTALTLSAGTALAGPAPVVEGTRLVCDQNFDATKEEIAAYEAACLGKTEGVVARDGDKLVVKLGTGQSKTYDSNPKACDDDEGENCKRVWLEAFDPKLGFAIVQESYYEGGSVRLLDLKTGTEVDISENPHFSPSGQQLVSVVANEMEPPENEILLYDVSASPFKRSFAAKYGSAAKLAKKKKDDVAMFEFVGWDGEDKINLKVSDGGETILTKALLSRKDGKWTLAAQKGK